MPDEPQSADRSGSAASVGMGAPAGRAIESELVQACVAGDQRAWRELVERYGPLVHAVSRRLGLPDDLVEDAFQETFTILLRQLPRLERPEGLVNWLATTARRVGMRLAERRRRHARHAGNAVSVGPASIDDPTLERLELVQRVMLALNSLGERCRDLLLALTRPAAPSYGAIAEELRMPIGSIGPTRARCLARLMELVGIDGAPSAGGSR